MSPHEPHAFFPRKTVLMATDILTRIGHAGIDRMLLEFGVDDLKAGRDLGGLTARANALAKYALDNPQKKTAEGLSVAEAIVRRAEREVNRLGHLEPGTIESEFVDAVTRPRSMTETDSTEQKTEIASNRQVRPVVLKESASADNPPATQREFARRIFVVHGHDDAPREAVARFLERNDFEVVILNEQVNKGRTLIEKFEAFGDVGYVVILLTPDDLGGKVGESQRPRARQNVLLEWGYFIGRIGRDRVYALMKSEVELPSDTVGIVWQPFDEHGSWKRELARELEDAGSTIDWKKAMRG